MAHHSTARHGTAQHSTAQHSTAQHMELRCLPYQEASFAGSESSIVCNVAHQLVLVDIIEGVADSSALLQAIGPMHSVLLQLSQFASNHRQYATQLWLHTMQQNEVTIVGIVSKSLWPVVCATGQQHSHKNDNGNALELV